MPGGRSSSRGRRRGSSSSSEKRSKKRSSSRGKSGRKEEKSEKKSGKRGKERDRDRKSRKEAEEEEEYFYEDERVAVREGKTDSCWQHGDVRREGKQGKDGAEVQVQGQKKEGCYATIRRLPSTLTLRDADVLKGEYCLMKDFPCNDYSVWEREDKKSSSFMYYNEKKARWVVAENRKEMDDNRFALQEKEEDNSLHPGDTGDPGRSTKWLDHDHRSADAFVEVPVPWEPPPWAKDHPQHPDRRGKSRGRDDKKSRSRKERDSSRRDRDRDDKDKKDDKKAASGGLKRDPREEKGSMPGPGDLCWLDDDTVVILEAGYHDDPTFSIRRARVAGSGKDGRVEEVKKERLTPFAHTWSASVPQQIDLRRGAEQRAEGGPTVNPHAPGERVRDGHDLLVSLPAAAAKPRSEGADADTTPRMVCVGPPIPPRGRVQFRVAVERGPDTGDMPPRLDPSRDEPGGVTIGVAPLDRLREREQRVGDRSWERIPDGAVFLRSPRRCDGPASMALCFPRSEKRERMQALGPGDELRLVVDRRLQRVWAWIGTVQKGWDAVEVAPADGKDPRLFAEEGQLALFCCVCPSARLRVFPPALAPAGLGAAADLSRVPPPCRDAVRELVRYLEYSRHQGDDGGDRDGAHAARLIHAWAARKAQAGPRWRGLPGEPDPRFDAGVAAAAAALVALLVQMYPAKLLPHAGAVRQQRPYGANPCCACM